MKILHINSVSKTGSTGRICEEISSYLNDHKHEGHIAYSVGDSFEKGYKIGTSLDSKIHSLFSRITGKQAYFSKYSTKKLLNYIEDLNPDVIHLHNLHANYINLPILLEFLSLKDIPTVITLHDCWFFTGKCTHYTQDNCYKWKTNCGKCPRLKKDNPSWFFDQTSNLHKDKKMLFNNIPRLAVIGVSDWIVNEAQQSFLSSANHMTRIYNWIDCDIFKPNDSKMLREKYSLTDAFLILGVASNWSENKGLDKFIRLANVLPKETKIVIVGNIPVDIVLPENIIHIQEIHQTQDLVDWYSAADLFMNLSLEETFGKVTGEALACGTPAIVPNSTANPELIGEGCGYVVEDLSINTLLKTLSIVQKDGKNYYSKQCRDFAEKYFDKKERIEDHIEVYLRVSENR